MKSLECYKELIKEISPLLKENCFSRKGNCFYHYQENNVGLLDFQKSRKSTRDEILFTANIGICSGRLLKFFSPELLEQKLSIEACNWRERLGFLLPDKQDKWWIVDTVSFNSVVDDIKSSLYQTAIPVINDHITDEQLCDEWLSGRSPGLTDIQRLINVSVLLKATGAKNILHEILKELTNKSLGKPTEFMVKQHLQNLVQVNSIYES